MCSRAMGSHVLTCRRLGATSQPRQHRTGVVSCERPTHVELPWQFPAAFAAIQKPPFVSGFSSWACHQLLTISLIALDLVLTSQLFCGTTTAVTCARGSEPFSLKQRALDAAIQQNQVPEFTDEGDGGHHHADEAAAASLPAQQRY
jgi:hypothetical protein